MAVLEPVAQGRPDDRAPTPATGDAIELGLFALLPLAEPDSAFLIVRNRDGLVVGACGLKDATPGGVAEIGYEVFSAHRRQGAATEAVLGLLQFALARGVAQVLAEVDAGNQASIQVVRRLGFVESGRRCERASGSSGSVGGHDR